MTEPAPLRLVTDDFPELGVDVRPTPAGIPAHDVQFYESEEFLADAVVQFLADGLRAGQPLIVIATETHRRAFAEGLRKHGFEIDDLLFRKDFVLLDARETLSCFMEGPTPNRELFFATVGDVFEKVLKTRTYLVTRAYGEMVDLLWKDGNVEGAIALEELWNEIAAKYSFTLLCAYAMGNFFKEAHADSFRRICDAHTHALPTETYALADDPGRLRQITLLQQRARALEAEVQHRKELEAALRDVLAQRRIVEETLRRTEQELRDVLENAAEAMHWVGADGIILWANKAELDLLGFDKSEYVGHHVAEFHADRQVIADILSRLSRNETLKDYEARLVCKDGCVKPVSITSNVYWRNGKFAHTRCFTREIQASRRRATSARVSQQ